jgi:hypothetical protein
MKKFLSSFSAIVLALAIVQVGLFGSAASASTTLDVNSQEVSFETAVFSVSSATGDGTNTVFTTVGSHFLIVGNEVSTQGFANTAFNLTNKIITAVTSNTFTVASTANGSALTGLVTITPRVYPLTSADDQAGNVVRYTTTNTTALQVGTLVVIKNMNSGRFEGKRTITAIDAPNKTFDVSNATTGAATSGGQAVVNYIGENLVVGDVIDYLNVFSSGGTNVNARVEYVGQVNLEGQTGTAGQLEILDEVYGDTPAENKFINSELDFESSTNAASYGEFKVDFYTGTPANRTPITLQNLDLTIYDVDANQYVEVSNYSRYFLASSTVLTTQQVSGKTRFQAPSTGYSGNDSKTIARVSFEFDSVPASITDLERLPTTPTVRLTSLTSVQAGT